MLKHNASYVWLNYAYSFLAFKFLSIRLEVLSTVLLFNTFSHTKIFPGINDRQNSSTSYLIFFNVVSLPF